MRRWLPRAVALALAPLAVYMLVALAAAFLPTAADPATPGPGVRIYVASNGVHTDLLLPRSTAGVDWREEFPTQHFRAVAEDAPYLGFGWGDRDFYMATRRWADVDLALVWRALTGGGPTVVKVGNYAEPAVGERVAALTLSHSQYHRLARYVRQSLARRSDESPLLYPDSGYGDHDAFYAANGRYSAFATCNEWVAEGLRQAGVRMPLWSPFAWPITFWMRAEDG